MDGRRIYGDKDGVLYRCVGFNNNQFKMEVVQSMIPQIEPGVIEWMDELPEVVNKNEINEPLHDPNKSLT